jgi:hypothetical protein
MNMQILKTMKNSKTISLMFILGISLTFLASCEKSLIGISGSGPIKTQEVDLTAFHAIESNIQADIHISKDSTQSITIKGQQNIIDNLLFRVSNGKLVLKEDKNVVDFSSLDLYIGIPSLNNVELNGTGLIETNDIFSTSGDFSADLAGSGKMDLTVNAESVNYDISGSGNIKLSTICKYIDGELTGSGDAILVGSALKSNQTTDGSGDIKAYDLRADEVKIEINGSGEAQVQAYNKLRVEINGSGDVKYKGNPSISSSITGSGKIRKVD